MNNKSNVSFFGDIIKSQMWLFIRTEPAVYVVVHPTRPHLARADWGHFNCSQ